MSVINQVMRDLEKRQASPLPVFAKHKPAQASKKPLLFLIGSLLGLIPIGFSALHSNLLSAQVTSTGSERTIPSSPDILPGAPNTTLSNLLADESEVQLVALPEPDSEPETTPLAALKPEQNNAATTDQKTATAQTPISTPNSGEHLYRIQPGDTLSAIFAKFNISHQEARHILNSGVDVKIFDLLQPEQLVHVWLQPDGRVEQLQFAATAFMPQLNIRRDDDAHFVAHPAPQADSGALSEAAVTTNTPLPDVKSQPTQRDNHYQQAINALQQGQTQHAQTLLRQALQAEPSDQQARLTLASLYLQQHNNLSAIKTLEDGLAYTPGSENLLLLANTYLGQQQTDKAITLLNSALQKTRNAALNALLATSYQRAEQHQQAILQYQLALRSQSAEPKWWVGLAISYEATGQHNLAEQAYQKAMQLGLPDKLRQYAQGRLLQIARS